MTSDQRIRLALDITRWSQSPTDVISQSSVAIANGADLQFELAFSYGDLLSDAQLINPTNWSVVTIQLKDSSPRTGNPYWSKDLSIVDFNAGLTYAHWVDGSDQNCVIKIDASVNSILLADDQDTFWIVISVLTTDVPGKVFTVAAFPVLIVDTGANNNPPVNVSTPTYYTAAQCDARFVQLGGMSAYLPLAAGPTFPLSGTLYTGAALSDAINFGHSWTVGVGNSGAELDVKISGTAFWKFLTDGTLQIQKLQLINTTTGQTRDLTLGDDGEIHGL